MLTAILDQLEPPHAPVSVTFHVLLARSNDTLFRLFYMYLLQGRLRKGELNQNFFFSTVNAFLQFLRMNCGTQPHLAFCRRDKQGYSECIY